DPTIGNVTLTPVKFDSEWIKVSPEMLQDNSFDIEGYILRAAAERIGRAFNAYSTTGTGSGQPQGVVAAATTGVTSVDPDDFSYEDLLDLIHSIDASYRESPAFRLMMHDRTLAHIRQLKDGNGRYIFAAGAAGAPSAILDYPYVVNNDMTAIDDVDAAGEPVVIAGDFSRYMVRDVSQPMIVRATE